MQQTNYAIDYRLIGNAIDYYEQLGYKYVHLPWSVPIAYIEATLPANSNPVTMLDGEHPLIGSAEQAFLQYADTHKAKGKFMSVTPCFRSEAAYNIYTAPYFVKLELFCNNHDVPDYEPLICDANAFMGSRIKVIRIGTSYNSDDLVAADTHLELGSYGIRSFPAGHTFCGESYAYGTGLAEPRFSSAIAKATCNGGYHTRPIPKFGPYSPLKVLEECNELLDAFANGQKLLALNEMADIVLALRNLLDADEFAGITFEDIVAMSKLTELAFISGARK